MQEDFDTSHDHQLDHDHGAHQKHTETQHAQTHAGHEHERHAMQSSTHRTAHGSGHGDHVDHTDHEQMFRDRFWVNLVLTVPSSAALRLPQCDQTGLETPKSENYLKRRLDSKVSSVTVGKNLSVFTSDSEPCVSLSISHGSSVHEPLS